MCFILKEIKVIETGVVWGAVLPPFVNEPVKHGLGDRARKATELTTGDLLCAGTIAERDLRTETGEAGGNPEAGWKRGAKAWHSLYPARQKQWNPTFSQYSYGFRPRRSAHHAVAQAQQYIAQGYGWVIALDLEKFFDQVNHDKLMGQIAKRVEDKRR